jgi:hypothetical protein
MDDEFFPPIPPRPRSPVFEQPPWSGPPRGEVGRAVAVEPFLLARGEDVAVVVDGLRAYTTGFAFELSVVARPGSELGSLTVHRHDHPDPDTAMRLGLEFADGRRALDAPPWRAPEPNQEADRPVLRQGGGGGSHDHYRTRYWAWPLPPPGPLTFACRWSERNIPLSRHTIAAEPILDAAASVPRIWD